MTSESTRRPSSKTAHRSVSAPRSGTTRTSGRVSVIELHAREERVRRRRGRRGGTCKVQNNVSLYRGVVVDDEVFVGPSAVFTNDRVPRATNPHWEIVGSGSAGARPSAPTPSSAASRSEPRHRRRGVGRHPLGRGSPAGRREPGPSARARDADVARGEEPPPTGMALRIARPCARSRRSGGTRAHGVSVSMALQEEAELVLEVLRSGHLARDLVERFEAAFAEIAGVRHAVAVNKRHDGTGRRRRHARSAPRGTR